MGKKSLIIGSKITPIWESIQFSFFETGSEFETIEFGSKFSDNQI